MRKSIVLVLMCAGALAACHKDAQDMGLVNWQKAEPLRAGVDMGAQPAAAAPAGELAATPAAQPGAPAQAQPASTTAPATAAAGPVRKAGLWEITSAGGPGPGPGGGTTKLCVTAESEARRGVFAQGRGGAGCTPKVTKTANGWTATTSCTIDMGDVTMQTSSQQTLTGDLSSRYTITGSSTRSGAPNPQMNGTSPINVTAAYKGPCPAGQKGGDMTMADGTVRNVFDAPRGGPGGGGFGPRPG